ncbi:Ig-like domain-containing protein [Caulobacter segnis]|uniref:Ig-like domain-containing protein n=1 Tax=Caulobacter segnis TaxID=88688 RepID=UPI00285FD291|nr:Ig-like domain-containing protein [Caulobacter segnis]MDR6624321.1 YD repeat-containing protein [Caulobacter segnis]
MARFGGAASALAILVTLSTSADGQAQSVQSDYAYDVHGRLVKVTRQGKVTDYTYDNAQNRTRVVISAGNSIPVANADSLTASAGGAAVSINPLLNDTDSDSDPLTVTGVGNAAQGKGSTAYTANSVTYTAYSGQTGTDSFTYTISDGKGGSATGTINVTINAAVAPPVTSASTTTVTANYGGGTTSYPLNLSISGGTPTSLTITSAPPASAGAAVVSGTSILFTPVNVYSGQTQLQYTATNAGGTSSAATATINVKPVVSNVSGTAATGSPSSLALNPRTNYTSMNLASQPSYGTANISGTTVVYTPNPGTAGLTDSFSYTSTSAGGTSAAASISFNITQGNRPPNAVDEFNPADDMYQSTTATLYPLRNDSDPDAGDSISLQSIGPLEFVYGSGSPPSNLGTITKTGNTVSYTAPPVCNCAARSQYHVIRFNYTIVDSHGATSTARHAVAVYSNQPPVAVPDTTDHIPQSTSRTIDPRVNDTDGDGDPLTIISIDAPYVAYAMINGVYYPSRETVPAAYLGSASFTGSSITYNAPFLTSSGATNSSYMAAVVWYTISDGRGGTARSYQVFNIYGPQ